MKLRVKKFTFLMCFNGKAEVGRFYRQKKIVV